MCFNKKFEGRGNSSVEENGPDLQTWDNELSLMFRGGVGVGEALCQLLDARSFVPEKDEHKQVWNGYLFKILLD